MIERKDKLKNKAKVIKEVIKDPLSTQRDISDKTWLGLWTVNRQLKDLEQNGTKDDRILWLLDWDLDLLKEIQRQKAERLSAKTVNDSDIDKWENTANKRRIMFWEKDMWDNTVQVIIT